MKLNKRQEAMLEKVLNGGTSTTKDKEFAEYCAEYCTAKGVKVTNLGDGKYELSKCKTAPKSTKKSAPKSKGVDIMDFEPCTFKDSDNYVWGGKRGYKAMRSAYCYAVQTNGKAKNLAEASKLGIEIDFDKKWADAKKKFESTFTYVKAADR